MEKTLLVVAGPTAVGKTAAAITFAHRFGSRNPDTGLVEPLPILSADSRQCYRELRIGVARPGPEELAAAPHYFIATHSIHEEVNAAVYERYALDRLTELFRLHDTVIVVGGTGLYLHALLHGMDPMPEIDPGVRASVQRIYAEEGLAALQELVRQEDPRFAADGDMQNPQRLMRALEVVRSSGQSIRDFQQSARQPRPFRYQAFVLDLPREVLYARINRRVDQMMAEGLLEEAKAMYPYRDRNALQTVGYTELFAYLEGKSTLEEAVEKVRQHTRNYAKRQLTWFRKQEGRTWVQDPESIQWMND